MISPVPDSVKPTDKDYVTEDYKANVADTKNFFDTWITFERADCEIRLGGQSQIGKMDGH